MGVINARWLGPEGVGVFALLAIIPTLSFQFGSLGLGTSFAFFVARKRVTVQKIMRVTWAIGLAMSLVACLILLTIRRYEFSPWNNIDTELFYLVLPVVPIFFVRSYMGRILSGQLRFFVLNLAHIIRALLSSFLTVLFVVVMHFGVKGAVYALAISEFVVLAYYVVHLLGSGGLTNDEEPATEGGLKMIQLWQYSRWSYLNIMCTEAYERLPMLFLENFTNLAMIGNFSRAYNMSQRPRLAITSFSQLLFPYTAASETGRAVQRTNMLCRNMLMVMLLMAVLLGLMMKPFVLFVYGERFRPAVTVLYALLPAITLFPADQFLAVHLAGDGKPKLTFLTSLCGTVAAVGLCIFLVPKYGALGAAFCVSGTYAVLVTARLIVYVNYTGSKVSEVLLPQKTDIPVFQCMFTKVVSRVLATARSVSRRRKTER